MEFLQHAFVERVAEIQTYLDLLRTLEEQVQNGPPRVGTKGVVTTDQMRILYSSVYLQLYNLVEATVTRCIEAVSDAIAKDNKWMPADLSSELRREWVRYLAKTHEDLNYDNRLESSLKLCNHLIQILPVSRIKINKGGGGNWDDEEIYRVADRIGCNLTISTESNKKVKKPYRNGCGALVLIMRMRNGLAHGELSFGECGSDATVADLTELTTLTTDYLRQVAESFQKYIDSYGFLLPDRRPKEPA